MLLSANFAVMAIYVLAVIGAGIWFSRRHQDSDEYMAAGRTLPGWAIGLSMFGSYISSISFLAVPGKAYAADWNAYAFSLATPLAAICAARWFVPFYRSTGEVSAYEHLERRFGRWARTYATFCFLLLQMARSGVVIYLMSIAIAPLVGLDVRAIILVTTCVMVFYTFAGGIKAVVWAGVLQSGVLIAGTLLCVIALVHGIPGGAGEIIRVGIPAGKFSLGSFGTSVAESTFWVSFAFGFVTHLGNFGADQSYIQRYLTARSESDARRSVYLTAWLYVPASGAFFFIGTGLFVFYLSHPELSLELPPDHVFPHFIATQLPAGAGGLVIAAILAASMDSNINSMATLTLCDLYKPYFRPAAGERESLRVLRIATLGWGIASGFVSLAMIQASSALDTWWQLTGICSGGVLGIILLGMLCRRANSFAASTGAIVGVIVICWISLPQLMDLPDRYRTPLHANLTMVVGTLATFLVGYLLSQFKGNPLARPSQTRSDG
jgi:SSS family solute:Na+ symporter